MSEQSDESRQRNEQQRWLSTVRRVMKSAEGRELVHTLLERCRVFRQTLVPGAPDATAFNEGRRSIGLQLLQEVLDAAPESYMQVMTTMKERSNNHETND